ncbi:hypothetical protein NDU88_002716 [Pleurodeles waltl]|uniref:Uncharacterized protein n=1 Tax=Pleurodeles waltl TaxID=8319 RepID=A0AAV7MNW0_PLEWA|nr:hypothetical protein NDU88_002716 [Pleurodeles waltl]
MQGQRATREKEEEDAATGSSEDSCSPGETETRSLPPHREKKMRNQIPNCQRSAQVKQSQEKKHRGPKTNQRGCRDPDNAEQPSHVPGGTWLHKGIFLADDSPPVSWGDRPCVDP